MISTITVQRPHKMPPSDAHYTRNSNSAGAPLPIIPRRTTRSHSLPASQPSSQRPFIPTSCHRWSPHVIDSDSSSSSTSESSRSLTRTRRRRVKSARTNTSSPAGTTLPLLHTDPPCLSYQPQVKQEKPNNESGENVRPIAAPRPLVYAPGMLRLSLETMRSHMVADSHIQRHDPRSNPGNGSKSAPPDTKANEGSRIIIRKKSGQPVKSSLKASRSSTSGNLSVVTVGSSSKSEPPTPKVVHFDTKLEHVKLFLAEQKPLAVSRDGSPTDDTSGTDSDFPSFIYGDEPDTRRARRKLVMRLINMAPKFNPGADVALEDFYLNFDGTNILGKIRVRNIAYCKTITVRFTFDSWQTTSEVTGRYAESIDPQFDRFSFSIRLNDLLARIEGKTFMMAIRYNVDGQEFWDNNNQQNYVAVFTKAKVSRESKRSDDEDASDVENLRNRLEQVILQGKEKSSTLRSSQTAKVLESKETDLPSLKSGIALSSRYDFATSLRNPSIWNPSDVPAWGSPSIGTRTLSPPAPLARSSSLPLPPSSIPWPEKRSPPRRPAALPVSTSLKGQSLLGSPRDHREELLLSPPRTSLGKLDDNTGTTRTRNHQRAYLDIGSVGTSSYVRRTPPGTPTSKPTELDLFSIASIPSPSLSSSRCHSFPPLTTGDSLLLPSPASFGFEPISAPIGGRQLLSPTLAARDFSRGLGLNLGESSGDSDLSTPSLSTPTSSRSTTPSPTDPFTKPTLPLLGEDTFGPVSGLDMANTMQPVSPGTNYRHFLSK